LFLSKLFARKAKANEAIVIRTYETIVAAARQPLYFSDWNVPDTALGRFESLSLHMILFLRRSKAASGPLRELAQEVVEEFFKDVDHSLRELGIGDPGVPKRMKKLAKMFYGRAESYDKAIADNDQGALAAALHRNINPVIKEWPYAANMAGHVFSLVSDLDGQNDESLVAGNLSFPKATL
jgi:cytochrome b pre-mRNA-processing protein 3